MSGLIFSLSVLWLSVDWLPPKKKTSLESLNGEKKEKKEEEVCHPISRATKLDDSNTQSIVWPTYPLNPMESRAEVIFSCELRVHSFICLISWKKSQSKSKKKGSQRVITPISSHTHSHTHSFCWHFFSRSQKSSSSFYPQKKPATTLTHTPKNNKKTKTHL